MRAVDSIVCRLTRMTFPVEGSVQFPLYISENPVKMETYEYIALGAPRSRTSVGKIMIFGLNNLIRHILCYLLLRLAHRQIKDMWFTLKGVCSSAVGGGRVSAMKARRGNDCGRAIWITASDMLYKVPYTQI